MEELFALEELAPYAMDQKILVDGVEIEEENQTDETAHGLGQDILGVIVLVNVSIREKKGGQPEGEKKRDNGGGCPKPPLAVFNSAEVGARVV